MEVKMAGKMATSIQVYIFPATVNMETNDYYRFSTVIISNLMTMWLILLHEELFNCKESTLDRPIISA